MQTQGASSNGTQTAPYLPAAPLPVRAELECYQIRELLGQGGFGISYRAYDSRLRREVVLKEHFPQGICYRTEGQAEVVPIDEEVYRHSLDVFLREAQVLAGIKHPGITSVHEVFHACNTAYMVLEYAEGYNLKQRAEIAPFTTVELRHILCNQLRTLSYLHTLGILHRDIKPANIILQDELQPVLIDFGAALTEMPEHTITTVGSQAFSAPEQFTNHRKLGPWSDLYALGNTILFLLPDEAEQDLQLLQTLKKAVEFRPEDRWQSADEWLAALNTPLPAAEPAPHKRKLLLPILLSAGLIPAAVGGYILLSPTEPAATPTPQPPPITAQAESEPSPEPVPAPEPTPAPLPVTPTVVEDETAPVSEEAYPLPSQPEDTPSTTDRARVALHSLMHPEQQKELYERELNRQTKDLTNHYQIKRMEIAGKAMSGIINGEQKATELQELHRQYVENYNAISRKLAEKYSIEPIIIQ